MDRQTVRQTDTCQSTQNYVCGTSFQDHIFPRWHTHTYVHTCTCRGESFRVISVFKLLTVIWPLVLISLRGSFSHLCPCISQSSNVPTFRSYQCTCGYFRFKNKLPIMHWLWWGKLSIEIFLKSYFCCFLAMRVNTAASNACLIDQFYIGSPPWHDPKGGLC